MRVDLNPKHVEALLVLCETVNFGAVNVETAGTIIEAQEILAEANKLWHNLRAGASYLW